MKRNYISLVLFLFVLTVSSQEYRRMIAAGTFTVQEIQQEAELYFAEVGTERGKGYNPYKRWEYNALRNMDENGMLKTAEFYFNELENYNRAQNESTNLAQRTVEGTWQEMGPTSWNATSGWNPGVGRITSIAVESVTNNNHIIIGGQSGGVWKTVDGGTTWSVLTDNLSNIYVYSLAIHPSTPSTYFWGSNGGTIFKSTDGGSTWNLLADTGGGNVNKILIDPANTNKMYCSVEGGGLYKSTDAGVNWSLIDSGATNGYDFEFKPGANGNVVYASGNNFYKSIDGGATFTQTGGFSNGPKMIGVSPGGGVDPNDVNVVYVLEASGGVFGGFYKSTDSGDTFSELDHTGKNYFGYSSTADDNSGQAPRDMDIAVDPQDINEVHIAGVLTWKSIDGGVNFNITSQWTPNNANNENIGYCHADVDLLMFVGKDLYVGSDGGIFVAENTGNVNTSYYRDLTPGLGIRQFYRIGVSQTDPEIVTGGAQDNGTSVMDTSGNWTDWLGADGMESFVDKNNNNILYGTSQNGSLYKSTNGGASYFGLGSPGGGGNWITPFEQDPITPDVIYSGYSNVYKSENGGGSWTTISQSFGGNLNHLKISPADNFTMFASRGNRLYRTQSGGILGSWDDLTPANPSSPLAYSGSINSIALHPTDPNKIAIATTGSGKVYISTDAGVSWTSYLNNLPNFSALALVWQNNGMDGLYVGMNYGVYYIDNTYTDWQPFINNLPNVEISELEINTANSKIYAGTYGRGLWRSNVFDVSLSTEEFSLSAITVFPNPAENEINIKWDKNEEVSIKIYNSLGKLMYFGKNQNLSNNLKINVANYASGLYFVKVNNIKGVTTKKVLIN